MGFELAYFEAAVQHVSNYDTGTLLIIALINKKKRCHFVDFAVLEDHSIKLNKYLNLVRKLKKLSYMRVTVIPILIGALGTISKTLKKTLDKKEIRGRTETFQTKALLKSAWILRKVLETWSDFLSIRLQKKKNPTSLN